MKKIKITCVMLVLCLVMLFGCDSKNNNYNYIQLNDKNAGEYSALALPDETFEYTKDNNPFITGTLKFKITDLTVIDNLTKAEIDPNTLKQGANSGPGYNLSKGRTMNLDFPYYFDGTTGQLVDGCYLLLFEFEVTNIDAVYDYYGDSVFSWTDFLWVINQSDVERNGGLGTTLVYFEESDPKQFDRWDTFRLNKGETRKLHVGFIAMDGSDTPFTKMGLMAGQGYIYYWFDLSDTIAQLENK